MAEHDPAPIDPEPRLMSARPDFIPIILDVMASRHLRLRGLTGLCGLSRSRLGLLLHQDPTKRSQMTLHELQLILEALGIDLMQALVRLHALEVVTQADHSARYSSLITMLSRLFHDLPRTIVIALEDLDDMDGTEVRPEWAPALERALVKRLVHEVNAVLQRRTALSDFSVF